MHFSHDVVCRTKMSVRLSVRPPVTRRYCAETAEHIIKSFSPPDSHTILVFSNHTLWQYSDHGTLTGKSNAVGV